MLLVLAVLGSALISAQPASAELALALQSNSAPAAPTAVDVTRSDGTLSASWDAPTGAAKYHVTYTISGNHQWVSAPDNHSGTSITINGVDNHATYVVGVRAGNDHGWSTWTNSSPIAPQVPAAPANVGLTRAAGRLTVTWTAVGEATSYNINLSADGTNSWTRALSGATGTSATIDSGIDNGLWYIAAVQAVNAKGGGGWTNSEFVAPIYSPGPVGNLTATRSGTGLSVSWEAPADNGGSAVTGYDLNYTVDGVHSWTRAISNQSGTSATIPNVSNAVDYVVAVRARNGVGDGGAWTNSAPVAGLAGPASVTAYKGGDYVEGVWSEVAGATGYDVNLLYFQNQYHYRIETNMSGTSRRVYINDGGEFSPEQFVIAVRARNEHGPGAWVNSPPATLAPVLAVSNIAADTATLTLSNHSGNWYYQANAAPHTTCQGPVSGTSVNLSTLTAGTTYTYTAYSASGCHSANELAAETFSTPVTVSNLSESNAISHTIAGTVQWAQEFTTGSNSGGYTLSSVTLSFAEVNSGANNITVSLRSRQSDGKPDTTAPALATLVGTVAVGDRTFTCSGAGCALEQGKQYFIHIAGTGNTQQATVNTTTSDNETGASGWSIADSVNYSGNNWNPISQGRSLKLRVTAVPK